MWVAGRKNDHHKKILRIMMDCWNRSISGLRPTVSLRCKSKPLASSKPTLACVIHSCNVTISDATSLEHHRRIEVTRYRSVATLPQNRKLSLIADSSRLGAYLSSSRFASRAYAITLSPLSSLDGTETSRPMHYSCKVMCISLSSLRAELYSLSRHLENESAHQGRSAFRPW